LPGGKIELGESAAAALIREAKKSLGLIIEEKDLIFTHVMSRKCNEPEFMALFFSIQAYAGDVMNGSPERHDDLRWFALDTLPERMVDAHRQAIEMMVKRVSYSEHGW